jgi:hypothetical protein
MPDHLSAAGEGELEHALRALGTELDYPLMPALAIRVRNRLEHEVSPPAVREIRPPYRPLRRSLAFAVVGLLLVGGAATAARFAVRGVEIRFRPTEPTVSPTPLPNSVSPGFAPRLSLGERVTLAEARRRVDFPMRLPALRELGTPDEVYADDEPAGGRVTAVYRARRGLPKSDAIGVGLLVTQFRAGFDEEFGVLKEAGPGTRVEQVAVNGAPGYWLEGEPHTVVFIDASGSPFPDTLRLAGNTLLWEQGGVTYRLEADISLLQALTIAQSFR